MHAKTKYFVEKKPRSLIAFRHVLKWDIYVYWCFHRIEQRDQISMLLQKTVKFTVYIANIDGMCPIAMC